MSRLATTIMIVVTLTCGTGAFYITRLMAQPATNSEAGSSWLENEPADTLAIEDTFNRDRKLLIEDIDTHRASLSDLFCDPDSTDDRIRQQTQTVIDAQRNLMLGIANHITAMRNILSPNQKKHLMRLCADTTRGPIRKQRRRGAPNQNNSEMTRTNGNGRGNGYGHGNGHGNGSGYRPMQRRRMAMNNTNSCGPKILRLASKLQLTDEQLTMITEQKPQFESNCRTNCANLAKKRAELLVLFEDQNTTDAQIRTAIDELTHIHSQIELSITEYLIILRPTLTDEQRNSLSTLCSNCPKM